MSNPAITLDSVGPVVHTPRPGSRPSDIRSSDATPPGPSRDSPRPVVQARTAPAHVRLHTLVMSGRQPLPLPQRIVDAVRLSWQAEASPHEGRKQLLRDARVALLEGLGKDARRFASGDVRRSYWLAGLALEQTHTDALRLLQVLFSGIALFVQSRPHLPHKWLVELVCSVAPTFLINPAGTGSLRSVTDIYEAFCLPHGAPALPPGLSGAGDMNAAAMRRARRAATASRQAFEAMAFPSDGAPIHDVDTLSHGQRTAVENLVRDTYAMHGLANDTYRQSRGAYLASADGKAAGALMNAAGASVTLLAFLGHFRASFYASLAVLLPQLLSGARDRNAMATHYLDAGIALDRASLILAQNRHLPVDDLQPEHADQKAARKRFDERTELPVKAIQEIALHELANLNAGFDKALSTLGEKIGEGDERLIARFETSMQRQLETLEGWRQDIEHFDSFELQRWAQIDPGRLGRHLDVAADAPMRLATRQMAARVARPGEVMSQVLQRYKQLTQDGPLSYLALYVVAKVLDTLGHRAIGFALLVIGALDWTLNTSQTRADKARDKRLLGKPYGSAQAIARDVASAKVPPNVRARWTPGATNGPPRTALDLARVEAAGRWSAMVNGEEKPLTGEAGYRRARPGTWGEVGRRGATVAGSAAFSAFRGLWRLYTAAQERERCTTELRAVVDAFQRAGFASTPGNIAHKNADLPGLLARLEEFDVVRQLRRRAPGGPVTSP